MLFSTLCCASLAGAQPPSTDQVANQIKANERIATGGDDLDLNGYSTPQAARHSAEMAAERRRVQAIVDADNEKTRKYYKDYAKGQAEAGDKAAQDQRTASYDKDFHEYNQAVTNDNAAHAAYLNRQQ